jgi:hypothetical protein
VSHLEQKEFIQQIKDGFPEFFQGKKVLDVGSLDLNGSLRDFFDSCDYIGIDVDYGPGVDVVCLGEEYDAPDSSFDVCATTECFEHNKPTGLIIMTCATTGRPEHGTRNSAPWDSPFTLDWDYYKNLTEEDFRNNFDIEKEFDRFEFTVHEGHKDLHFWGIKK